MKNTVILCGSNCGRTSLFSLVAAVALCGFGNVAFAEVPEPNQELRNLSSISVTYRDPSIIRADLKRWLPPKREWLEAKSDDIDPLFMIVASTDRSFGLIASTFKKEHGGGSGGITRDANGGGSSCIHQLKAGRFVEGGSYVAGAQSKTSPWGKNLLS